MLAGKRSLADECIAETLFPETIGHFDPVIALPDEAERVTAAVDGHDPAMHLRFFEPQDVRHAPVVQYELRDALIMPNGVAGPTRNFNRLGPLEHSRLLFGPVTKLDQAAYCLEDRSYHFFGHWLRSFAQCLLVDETVPILHFPNAYWSDAPHYEMAFGIRSEPAGYYHVDRLTLFQDFAQSSHKTDRYKELRQRLSNSISVSTQADLVYLKRGITGTTRVVSNEPFLEDQLQKLGFDIVDLSTTPIAYVMTRCMSARIALTVEGSHADHLHWLLRPGGTLWIMNPSDRFNTSHFAIAQAMGNHTACTVIEQCGPKGHYTADIARMSALLDKIG